MRFINGLARPKRAEGGTAKRCAERCVLPLQDVTNLLEPRPTSRPRDKKPHSLQNPEFNHAPNQGEPQRWTYFKRRCATKAL